MSLPRVCVANIGLYEFYILSLFYIKTVFDFYQIKKFFSCEWYIFYRRRSIRPLNEANNIVHKGCNRLTITYARVEICKLFIVEQFIRVGDVWSHRVGLLERLLARRVVHPLHFGENFAEFFPVGNSQTIITQNFYWKGNPFFGTKFLFGKKIEWLPTRKSRHGENSNHAHSIRKFICHFFLVQICRCGQLSNYR